MAYRRNIIISLTHGLRSDALGDSQTWPLNTPNLDAIGNRSMRVVASSACPADPGGMVSLWTGMHARQHGYVDQTDRAFGCDGFPAWLIGGGYYLAGVGNVGAVEPWLHESVVVEDVNVIDPVGCAYMDMIRAKGMDKTILAQRKTRARNGPFDPDRLLLEPDDDVDCFIGIQARQMMQDLPTDRPWALIVAFTGPGNDLPPPTIYDQMVEPSMLEDGFVPTDFTKVNALAELDYPRVSLQRLDRQRLARVRADYLGRVSLMDYVIGRIEEQAKERSDFDRTWMVTGSDRGYLMGEHGLLGHRSFLSGAIEVPIMVTPPTPVKTEMAEGLVSTVDLAATIAEIGGCDVPAAIAGRSLLAALRDEPVRTLTGGCCVSEFGRRLMLETERFKVIFDSVTNEVLGLYDLLNDPDERTNMTTDAAGRNLLDSLRWRLGDALMPLRALPVGG